MTDFTNKAIEFGWVSGENGWGDGMNENLQRISALLVASVLSAVVTAPPGSPTDGDGYLIPTGATGVWSARVGQLAYWSDLESDWLYFTPARGWQVWSAANDGLYYYTGSAWQVLILRVASGVQFPGSVLKLGTDASGSNVAATSVTEVGPLSTGTGTPAALVWQVGVLGSSGSTLQTATEAFRVQEIANASSREVAIGNVSGSINAGVPSTIAVSLLRNGTAIRATNTLDIIRAAATPALRGIRANGTLASPTSAAADDILADYVGIGYESVGQAVVNSANIRLHARENQTSTNRGGYGVLAATRNGSTSPQGILRWQADTSVGELVSVQVLLRLVPSSSGIAFRDSTNAADTFTVNAAGTTITAPLATAISFASATGFIVGGATANAAAILQADSTTRGFLPPRMNTTQRDAISSPPAGLVIYNTTTNKLNVYTTAWEAVTSA